MTATEQIDIESAISATLSEIFGSNVKIEVAETLRHSDRSKVMRCGLHSTSQNIPSTVVVKQALSRSGEIYDVAKAEGPAWRLFNEWAGLQFLKQSFGDQDLPVPHFIGGNREAGFILMEDLGRGKGLDHYLLSADNIAAQQHFISLFTIIGRIHAATSGKREEFDAIRSKLGPIFRKPLTEKITWHRDRQQKALSMLGINSSPEYFDEFEECLRLFEQPGSFQVYCHHDLCPDNNIVTQASIKILDFEFSDMGNAAIDMRYPRALLPTCWCVNRLPEQIIQQAEHAYRAEFVKGCPDAADNTIFYHHLIAGCAEAVMGMLEDLSLKWIIEKDSRLGIVVHQQRLLARLDNFIQISEEVGLFPQIRDCAHLVAQELRKHLPEFFMPLPVFPAFRETSL